jgi:hypothetical protein
MLAARPRCDSLACVTHEYTLLVGGVVIPGAGAEDATALAWAAGTVLAVGSDAEIHAISRGDSLVVDLRGAVVAARDVPLEVGGPADFDVFERDPRAGQGERPREPVATVLGGHVIRGGLPGLGVAGEGHRTFGP